MPRSATSAQEECLSATLGTMWAPQEHRGLRAKARRGEEAGGHVKDKQTADDVRLKVKYLLESSSLETVG